MLKEQKISIVVPSFNQGAYLGETLESLVIQNYPNLEVIVQDAGSADNSLQIAQSYAQLYPNIFKVFCQRDNGQAHGLNLGFKKATGTILGFLNSDDTLFPGCLARVANEINPQKGRFIVMGRCLFVGEDSPHGGLEHPCQFVNHFHQLAIWKRGANTIPQPSVFWHRVVWEKCGGFDESQQHVLDYELFCRFSRHFHFHKIDELWSTYRIHQSSKTFNRSEAEVMALAIRASRKNWGPWWSPLRWRLAVSYWLDNPQEFKRARHHARLTEEAFLKKKFAIGILNAGVTLGLSPKLALTRFVQPPSIYEAFSHLERTLLTLTTSSNISAPAYADGWIGPTFAEALQIPVDAKTLILQLHFFRPRPINTRIDFLIEGQSLKHLHRRDSEFLEVLLNVEQFRGKTVTLQILSNSSFVPRIHDIAEDDRELSMLILERSFAPLAPKDQTILLIRKTSLKISKPRYADGWIGPNFAEAMQIPIDAKTLILRLNFLRPRPIKTQIDFLIDGQSLKRLQRRHSECLEIALDVEQFRGKTVTFQILSTSSFVPRIHDIAEDDRELSMLILERSFASRVWPASSRSSQQSE